MGSFKPLLILGLVAATLLAGAETSFASAKKSADSRMTPRKMKRAKTQRLFERRRNAEVIRRSDRGNASLIRKRYRLPSQSELRAVAEKQLPRKERANLRLSEAKELRLYSGPDGRAAGTGIFVVPTKDGRVVQLTLFKGEVRRSKTGISNKLLAKLRVETLTPVIDEQKGFTGTYVAETNSGHAIHLRPNSKGKLQRSPRVGQLTARAIAATRRDFRKGAKPKVVMQQVTQTGIVQLQLRVGKGRTAKERYFVLDPATGSVRRATPPKPSIFDVSIALGKTKIGDAQIMALEYPDSRDQSGRFLIQTKDNKVREVTTTPQGLLRYTGGATALRRGAIRQANRELGGRFEVVSEHIDKEYGQVLMHLRGTVDGKVVNAYMSAVPQVSRNQTTFKSA
jgi:hypothetical protein